MKRLAFTCIIWAISFNCRREIRISPVLVHVGNRRSFSSRLNSPALITRIWGHVWCIWCIVKTLWSVFPKPFQSEFRSIGSSVCARLSFVEGSLTSPCRLLWRRGITWGVKYRTKDVSCQINTFFKGVFKFIDTIIFASFCLPFIFMVLMFSITMSGFYDMISLIAFYFVSNRTVVLIPLFSAISVYPRWWSMACRYFRPIPRGIIRMYAFVIIVIITSRRRFNSLSPVCKGINCHYFIQNKVQKKGFLMNVLSINSISLFFISLCGNVKLKSKTKGDKLDAWKYLDFFRSRMFNCPKEVVYVFAFVFCWFFFFFLCVCVFFFSRLFKYIENFTTKN